MKFLICRDVQLLEANLKSLKTTQPKILRDAAEAAGTVSNKILKLKVTIIRFIISTGYNNEFEGTSF